MKIGSIDVSSFKVGEDDCLIYLGDVKIYPSEETPSYPYKVHYTTSANTEVTINCDEDFTKPSNSVLQTINSLTIGDCMDTVPVSGYYQTVKVNTATTRSYGLQICPKFTMSDNVTTIREYGLYAFRYKTTAYTQVDLENSVLSKNLSLIQKNGIHEWKFDKFELNNCTLSGETAVSYITANTATFNSCNFIGSSVLYITANSITFNKTVGSIGYSATSLSADTVIVKDIQDTATANYFKINYPHIKNLNIDTERIPNSFISSGNSSAYISAITVSEKCTSVGNLAFNMSNINSITFLSETPPTMGNSNALNVTSCPIYVPSTSVEAYKAASGWSTTQIKNRIQAIT